MTVAVPDASSELLPAVVATVRESLAAVDATCNRFRDGGELSRLNAAADGRDVDREVSPTLARYLAAALEVAAATDGVVDLTVGRRLQDLGYDQVLAAHWDRSAGPRTDAATHQPLPTVCLQTARAVSWRDVSLIAHRVRMPAGVQLDLGATAKALAADEAARAAHATHEVPVAVNLGGDIAFVGTPEGHGWSVGVAERPRQDVSDEEVLVSAPGVATSTKTHRRWQHRGAVRHHLIDPLTGVPSRSGTRTATVVAGTCLAANAAAAAVVIRDLPDSWLAERGLGARLVKTDGQVRRVGPWPAPDGRHAA